MRNVASHENIGTKLGKILVQVQEILLSDSNINETDKHVKILTVLDVPSSTPCQYESNIKESSLAVHDLCLSDNEGVNSKQENYFNAIDTSCCCSMASRETINACRSSMRRLLGHKRTNILFENGTFGELALLLAMPLVNEWLSNNLPSAVASVQINRSTS